MVEENEFQNRLFLFSNFPGAAILNNCDVNGSPFVIRQKLSVSEQWSSQDTSQLFKMAAPRKSENKSTRF